LRILHLGIAALIRLWETNVCRFSVALGYSVFSNLAIKS